MDLSWEECHFMVQVRIVLGHKISRDRIEMDNAKISTIGKLPLPTLVRAIRNFLDHARFYRRFIQDFTKIARLLTKLLEKYAPFDFSAEYLSAFTNFKIQLIRAPIMTASDWNPI